MRPILRWAGSKRRIVSKLADYWDASGSTRYVEPFAGSAALFCSIEAKRAVLGDMNGELISMYETVRDHPNRVANALHRWPGEKDEYYEVRATLPESLAPEVRAARFLYLNRWCFNGIYRTNKLGRFNVPFGGSRVGPSVTREDLVRFSKLIRRTLLVPGDFSETLTHVEPGDFVYLDPPYSIHGVRVFNEYVLRGFGASDLQRLRLHLENLHSMQCRFLVSYADCEEGRALGQGFKIDVVEVTRNVGGFRSRRRKAREILIHN